MGPRPEIRTLCLWIGFWVPLQIQTLAPREASIERIWHIQDSQGQILALALRHKSFKPSKLFPLRSEAGMFALISGQVSCGGPRPFHQRSICLTQLTLRPHEVQIWARQGRNFDPTKPSKSTVWCDMSIQNVTFWIEMPRTALKPGQICRPQCFECGL